MSTIEIAAEVVLNKCMALKENESCLILTDEKKLEIAGVFLKAAEKITKNVKLIQIPVPEVNGQEPPEHVAEDMKNFSVILMPTSKSLSWTKARGGATKAGSRVASMPTITKDIMQRAIDIPYEDMKDTNTRLIRELSMAQTIEITAENGTNLVLSVKIRKWHGLDSGIYDNPGKWGNLPSGEVFVAPVEGTANGTFVIDASMAGIGKLNSPITVEIKDGFAVKFSGEKEAGQLKEMLDNIKDRNAFNIAELGIGTNPKARVIGNVLEDEKVLGTCHIAFGNNALFGGNVDVPIHVDGVMSNPTIKADGKTIMRNGDLF